MIALFSDTHSHDGHALEGAALETVRGADTVIHAGDFTSPSALADFERASATFHAVHGNADSAAVRSRLPESQTVEAAGIRFAVTHRRRGGATELELFGRSQDADVVVSGHTHRPSLERVGDLLLVNPGSHAQPRGNRPGFGTVVDDDGLEVRLHDLTGAVVRRESVSVSLE